MCDCACGETATSINMMAPFVRGVFGIVAAVAVMVATMPSTSTASTIVDDEPECPADVVLLLDGSTSISSASWAALVNASTTFANDLGVSEDGARLAVVQFASSAKVELPLTGDKEKAVKDIKALSQVGWLVRSFIRSFVIVALRCVALRCVGLGWVVLRC